MQVTIHKCSEDQLRQWLIFSQFSCCIEALFFRQIIQNYFLINQIYQVLSILLLTINQTTCKISLIQNKTKLGKVSRRQAKFNH